MNSLNTNKSYNFIDLFNKNLVSCSLSTVVLFSVLSSPAFANRPAMDEPQAPMAETSEAIDEQVNATSHRPADDAPHASIDANSMDSASMGSTATDPASSEMEPSSVDLIMQQQHQQTRGVLQLPAKEMQAGETIRINALDFPRRGMSMDKVKNELGSPVQVSPTVGEPPITSWKYNDRTVYFERSFVIHAVATK